MSSKSQGESGVRYCYDESVSNQAKHTGTIARESVKTRIATAKSELLEAEASSLCGAAAIPFSTPDPLLSCTSPDDRYHILRDTPHSETIQQWLKAHAGDRAFENFTPLLKDHLLSRLMGRPYDGDENSFSPEEHDTVRFERDQIYFHKCYVSTTRPTTCAALKIPSTLARTQILWSSPTRTMTAPQQTPAHTGMHASLASAMLWLSTLGSSRHP